MPGHPALANAILAGTLLQPLGRVRGDEAGQRAEVIGERGRVPGGVDEHPARRAVAADEATLGLVRADLAGEHPLDQPVEVGEGQAAIRTATA